MKENSKDQRKVTALMLLLAVIAVILSLTPWKYFPEYYERQFKGKPLDDIAAFSGVNAAIVALMLASISVYISCEKDNLLYYASYIFTSSARKHDIAQIELAKKFYGQGMHCDAIRILQNYENSNYPDALFLLAEEYQSDLTKEFDQEKCTDIVPFSPYSWKELMKRSASLNYTNAIVFLRHFQSN